MISAVNVGFDKDLVHLPSFWKILSFSLFDFCQHQVLKPQEVLKSVTSLRDFGLFPQVPWSLVGCIFHALISKDYLWGKERRKGMCLPDSLIQTEHTKLPPVRLKWLLSDD